MTHTEIAVSIAQAQNVDPDTVDLVKLGEAALNALQKNKVPPQAIHYQLLIPTAAAAAATNATPAIPDRVIDILALGDAIFSAGYMSVLGEGLRRGEALGKFTKPEPQITKPKPPKYATITAYIILAFLTMIAVLILAAGVRFLAVHL